jgi:hypothetical protein
MTGQTPDIASYFNDIFYPCICNIRLITCSVALFCPISISDCDLKTVRHNIYTFPLAWSEKDRGNVNNESTRIPINFD